MTRALRRVETVDLPVEWLLLAFTTGSDPEAVVAATAGVARKQTKAATPAAQTPTCLPNAAPQVFACIPDTNERTGHIDDRRASVSACQNAGNIRNLGTSPQVKGFENSCRALLSHESGGARRGR
jgi:hypothetical protein